MPQTENDAVDLQTLIQILNKRRLIIIAAFLVLLILAVLYVTFTEELYTANTKILLDPEQGDIVSSVVTYQQRNFDSAYVDSQVEILTSRNLALAVLAEIQPPEFKQLMSDNNQAAIERMVQETIGNLTVARVDMTYVMSINYSSPDPVVAAQYANAYAQNFIFSQLDALKGTSGRAADWMQTRIDELRQKSFDAQARVDDFRRKYKLYDANGRPINEDQIKELNDQLGITRANVAAAKARYEYSQSVLENNDVNAAVAEALGNDVINTIRTSYLSTKKNLSELIRMLGPDHEAVLSLKEEQAEYEELILKEMERVAQIQLSDYKVALSRQKELESSLSDLISENSVSEIRMAELGGLEKEAEAYKELYSNYLEKFQQMTQQRSFPISETRVISEALPPLEKSHPRIKLILGVAMIMGVGVGCVLVLFLEFYDKRIFSGKQLSRIDVPFLGYFPMVPFEERRQQVRSHKMHEFRFPNPIYTASIDQPFSVQAEAMRKVKASIDVRARTLDSGCVIGVISCAEGEGKSTVAANLALTLAKSGEGCLLIDGDIKNPTLVKEMFEKKVPGIGQLVSSKNNMLDSLVTEAKTGLRLLPSIGKDTSELLDLFSQNIVAEFIGSCRSHFNYVLVDLPPIDATSDAYRFSSSIDYFLIVTQCGQTNYLELQNALIENRISNDKILGAVINKADLEELIKYHGFRMYPGYYSYS